MPHCECVGRANLTFPARVAPSALNPLLQPAMPHPPAEPCCAWLTPSGDRRRRCSSRRMLPTAGQIWMRSMLHWTRNVEVLCDGRGSNQRHPGAMAVQAAVPKCPESRTRSVAWVPVSFRGPSVTA